MALGFGANARFLAAFESDYGVPPATGWTAVQLSRHGLSAKQNLLANDLLGLGRDPAPPVPGAVSVDGEVGVPMDARAMGFWLKALLGEPVSAGAAPYTHTFVSGAPVIPSLSIQAANPDVPLFRTHLGVRLDKATFRLERDGLPGATLSLIAKGEVTDDDFRAATPAQYTPLRFGPLHGQIRKDGQPLGRVVSAEIGYANTLDRIETIRSDGMIDGAEPTAAACTGSITVRFDGTALFEAATTGTPVALERQLGAVTDPRGAAVDQALARLPEGATETQRRDVERLSGAFFDQKEAIRDLNEALDAEANLRDKGAEIVRRHRTAEEEYRDTLAELDELLRNAALDQDTYARAAEQATTRSLQAGEEAFVKWATTGKLAAGDLFNSIAEEALRAAWRMSVVKPQGGILEGLFSAIGEGMSGWFGGGGGETPAPPEILEAHSGGIVGRDPLRRRAVDPAVFREAERFHGGGLVGLRHGEVPIVALRGEEVLRRDDPRHRLNLAGVSPAAGVTVVVQPTVTNSLPNTQARTETRRGPSGEVMIDVFVEQMEMLMSRKIGRGEGLAPTLERRYGLNPAAGAYR